MKMSDRVVNELQLAIVSGQYPAGTRLPTESELGEQHGVSRTVVRDAFRTLASMGLVDVQQGRGTVVTVPSGGQVRQALELRMLRSELTMGDVTEARKIAESAFAREAAIRGTRSDWHAMERSLRKFEEAVAREAWSDAHQAHFRFHMGVLDALHQPALDILLQPLQEMVLLTSLSPDLGRVELWEVDSHRPILDALRASNSEAAAEAVRQHFEYIERPEYATFRTTLFREAHSLPTFGAVIGTYGDVGLRLERVESLHPQ